MWFVAGQQETVRAEEYLGVATVNVLEILVQERNNIDLDDHLIVEPVVRVWIRDSDGQIADRHRRCGTAEVSVPPSRVPTAAPGS